MYSRMGVDRALKFAFEYAKRRNANKPWKGLGDKDKEAGKEQYLVPYFIASHPGSGAAADRRQDAQGKAESIAAQSHPIRII